MPESCLRAAFERIRTIRVFGSMNHLRLEFVVKTNTSFPIKWRSLRVSIVIISLVNSGTLVPEVPFFFIVERNCPTRHFGQGKNFRGIGLKRVEEMFPQLQFKFANRARFGAAFYSSQSKKKKRN